MAEEVTEGKSRTASLPLFSSLIYLLVLCCPLFTNAFTQGDPLSSPSSSLLLRERSSLLAGCETTASCGRFALRAERTRLGNGHKFRNLWPPPR